MHATRGQQSSILWSRVTLLVTILGIVDRHLLNCADASMQHAMSCLQIIINNLNLNYPSFGSILAVPLVMRRHSACHRLVIMCDAPCDEFSNAHTIVMMKNCAKLKQHKNCVFIFTTTPRTSCQLHQIGIIMLSQNSISFQDLPHKNQQKLSLK